METTTNTTIQTCETCGKPLTARWEHDYDICAATRPVDPSLILHGHTSEDTAYVVEDYPYGFRLRCQIRYWIETSKTHGQRFCSQTSNPKRPGLVWNKPKKSTYSPLAYLHLNGEGHVKHGALGSWPTECQMQRFEALHGEHLTDYHRATLKEWRRLNAASKHITYHVTTSGPLDLLNSAEDRATAAEFDAGRQSKAEVMQVWNAAINRAVAENPELI